LIFSAVYSQKNFTFDVGEDWQAAEITGPYHRAKGSPAELGCVSGTFSEGDKKSEFYRAKPVIH
jgi:hypothetical protein